jgi:hypothetical protein
MSTTYAAKVSAEALPADFIDTASLDPRRWRALPIILIGSFLAFLDFFIVNIALPAIRADLRASPAQDRRRIRREVFFRNGRLRPSFHSARLPPLCRSVAGHPRDPHALLPGILGRATRVVQ